MQFIDLVTKCKFSVLRAHVQVVQRAISRGARVITCVGNVGVWKIRPIGAMLRLVFNSTSLVTSTSEYWKIHILAVVDWFKAMNSHSSTNSWSFSSDSRLERSHFTRYELEPLLLFYGFLINACTATRSCDLAETSEPAHWLNELWLQIL